MFIGTHLAAFTGSRISPASIEAYLTTEYQVSEPSRFVLLIGRRHYGLAALLASHENRQCAAVLTAWNPFSKRQHKSENELAQKALVCELETRKLPHFLGHGADPLGKWPAEESRLVLGIELDEAAALGRRFGQNGFVWAANDALPMLVLLR